jgi:hypothetical protein
VLPDGASVVIYGIMNLLWSVFILPFTDMAASPRHAFLGAANFPACGWIAMIAICPEKPAILGT